MRYLALTLLFAATCAATASADDHECSLDFKMKAIDGTEVNLHDYEGKVVLIVNTASRCGLTPHYAGLQELYDAHKEDGLVVLGFPCNQFGGQEPGSDMDIKKFCSTKYDVTFPMFSKVDVNGDDAAPLYKHLTGQDVKPAGKGRVSWNFEKFLIGRDGNVVARFAPRTKPSDAKLVEAIKNELGNNELGNNEPGNNEPGKG